MSVTIAESNADQAQAWDGEEGAYWAAHHELFEACLDRYEPAFLAATAFTPDDHVLDVGCGTGVTSRAAGLAAPRGEVLGVDLSAEMIGVAQRLAAQQGLSNVSFLQADAQVYPFAAESFDVVLSRTGAMFFGDPHEAFGNLCRSLKRGGRLALLTWRTVHEQEWLQDFAEALTGAPLPAPPPGAPGPFSLSDPEHVSALLDGAGFTDVRLSPVTEAMTYGRTVDEAHDLVLGLLGWMLRDQTPEQAAARASALRTTMEAHHTDDGVRFDSAAWLVTAVRPQANP